MARTKVDPKRQADARQKLMELSRDNESKLNEKRSATASLRKKYLDGPQTEVTISPMYRPYLGKNVPVVINGFPIYIPVNGRAYKIPEEFARVVFERIRRIDDTVLKQTRMSMATENFERYPGASEFIRRA